MDETIERYITYQSLKRGITAAMVTGSYVTGTMGPRSDIDLFFIWGKEFESMRGREYFEGVEFEYFISPEWKYYDRLRTDLVSVRIYSSAKILLDPGNKLQKIREVALKKMRDYAPTLNEDSRRSYQFWLETICSDGEDLFESQDYASFLFFTGVNLPKMNDLICLLHSELPTYEKYGVKEIQQIDATYGALLERFLTSEYTSGERRRLWVELCVQLTTLLGPYDLTDYESHQRLI